MSNIFKAKNHLQSIMTTLDNVEHGRVPITQLEAVFEDRAESIRNLIHAELRDKNLLMAQGDKGGA